VRPGWIVESLKRLMELAPPRLRQWVGQTLQLLIDPNLDDKPEIHQNFQ